MKPYNQMPDMPSMPDHMMPNLPDHLKPSALNKFRMSKPKPRPRPPLPLRPHGSIFG